MKLSLLFLAMLLSPYASAQNSHWADADDKTAQQMISLERRWASVVCDGNDVAKELLADDFQGTGTDGSRYTKAEEVKESKKEGVRDCRLDSAKVRFFGDNVAIIYGSESSLRKDKSGKESRRCQVWGDTWLKRNGRWQIINAQDSIIPCK